MLKSDDRRRMYALGNRLWHTDASFQDPPGRYSMLSARVVPAVAADTEFADMRAAYDALPCGDEGAAGGAARAPLDRVLAPDTRLRVLAGRAGKARRARSIRSCAPIRARKRRSLYVASHASRIIDWPVPEGRLAAARSDGACDAAAVRLSPRLARRRSRDLGQPRHDASRAPFDDASHRRELRRVTTLDIDSHAVA